MLLFLIQHHFLLMKRSDLLMSVRWNRNLHREVCGDKQTAIHPDTKMEVLEKTVSLSLFHTHKEQKRDVESNRNAETETQKSWGGGYQIWKSVGHREKTSGMYLSMDITNELKSQPMRHLSQLESHQRASWWQGTKEHEVWSILM